MSTRNLDHNDQISFSDLQNESSLSSCSSSPLTSLKPIENDSGCGSDDDPTLALKINKGLSMGYDYELIRSVIQQQNNGDDMSKFIETIVRTAEVNGNSIPSPSSITNDSDCSETVPPHDVYIIDGADLAYSFGNNTFSWRGIEICLKYLHTHGHKKVFVVLPYSLKHYRHEQNFSESKSLRDLERKNLLIYTNRLLKQTSKPNSYTHISEMLKLSQKTKGYLITNVSLKDVILDFTIYKQILEEKVIRYRFQNDNFQPLLITIVNDNDGNDCETHYPLCPYGKKCTYGSKCKYFHIERRHQNLYSISESLQQKARLEKSKIQHGFNQTKSGPDRLHMYTASLADDARIAYEYGLTSTPTSNDFSFIDQRVSASPHFPTPNEQHPSMNRSFSMPQQMLSLQQFEQNILRFLSMLSVQEQNNYNPMTTYMQQQQENQYDHSSVNSQQGLADNIQGVRHLWETENQSLNSPQFIPVQQQISSVFDSNISNPMFSTFQQPTQNFLHR